MKPLICLSSNFDSTYGVERLLDKLFLEVYKFFIHFFPFGVKVKM